MVTYRGRAIVSDNDDADTLAGNEGPAHIVPMIPTNSTDLCDSLAINLNANVLLMQWQSRQ